MSKAHLAAISGSKNFDVPGSSQEQNNGGSQGATGSEAEVSPIICYGARTVPPLPSREVEPGARYLVGGTKRITVEQAIHLKAAVNFAELVGQPLNAHLITPGWFVLTEPEFVIVIAGPSGLAFFTSEIATIPYTSEPPYASSPLAEVSASIEPPLSILIRPATARFFA